MLSVVGAVALLALVPASAPGVVSRRALVVRSSSTAAAVSSPQPRRGKGRAVLHEPGQLHHPVVVRVRRDARRRPLRLHRVANAAPQIPRMFFWHDGLKLR